MTVDATVNGRPVRALVDSGAQYSVIDAAFAAHLGLPGAFAAPMIAYGVGGKPQLGRGVSLDVAVGALALPALRAAVLDLGPISGAVGLSVPFVLGQDLLSEVLADIDFPGRRIRFVQPKACRPRPAPSPSRRAAEGRALLAQVRVEGAPLEPVLDTGASSALVLAHDVAEEAGLLSGREVRPARSMVLGGVASGRMVTVSTLAFGGEVLRDVPVHVPAPAHARLPERPPRRRRPAPLPRRPRSRPRRAAPGAAGLANRIARGPGAGQCPDVRLEVVGRRGVR